MSAAGNLELSMVKGQRGTFLGALTNTFECFHGKYNVNQLPVVLYIGKRVLTLPLYADLSLKDVDRICDIILKCRKK